MIDNLTLSWAEQLLSEYVVCEQCQGMGFENHSGLTASHPTYPCSVCKGKKILPKQTDTSTTLESLIAEHPEVVEKIFEAARTIEDWSGSLKEVEFKYEPQDYINSLKK